MVNAIPVFELGDVEQAAAKDAFLRLGQDLPMMAVRLNTVDTLADFTPEEYGTGGFMELPQVFRTRFYEAAAAVMNMVAPENDQLVPLQETIKFGFMNRQPAVPSAAHRLPRHFIDKPAFIDDIHGHVDDPHVGDVPVYGLHITTRGSGTVLADFAERCALRVSGKKGYRPRDVYNYSRDFTTGDAHIFVRRGTEAMAPTAHHFLTIGESGRSFMEFSVGREQHWPANL